MNSPQLRLSLHTAGNLILNSVNSFPHFLLINSENKGVVTSCTMLKRHSGRRKVTNCNYLSIYSQLNTSLYVDIFLIPQVIILNLSSLAMGKIKLLTTTDCIKLYDIIGSSLIS